MFLLDCGCSCFNLMILAVLFFFILKWWRKNVPKLTRICGVYAIPGTFYPFKLVIFYLLIKYRQVKKCNEVVDSHAHYMIKHYKFFFSGKDLKTKSLMHHNIKLDMGNLRNLLLRKWIAFNHCRLIFKLSMQCISMERMQTDFIL